MATFEIGKKYFTTSACDHNCVFVVEIVKRTAKTVTFRRDGQERRAKIYTDHDGEYIIPERYSMAPFSAPPANTWRPEEVEEIQDPVSAFIPQAVQPAGPPRPCDGWTTRRRKLGCHVSPGGRRDVRALPKGRPPDGPPPATMAVIRWEDGRTSMEALEDIHPAGWRSPSGSPLGVFFAR